MPHLFDLVKANLRDSAPAGRYTCPGCKTEYGRLDVILLSPGAGQAFYACATCYRGGLSRSFGSMARDGMGHWIGADHHQIRAVV